VSGTDAVMGFAGGLLAGTWLGGKGAETVTLETFARELDRATVFALLYIGPVGIVGTRDFLDPAPGEVRSAFVAGERRWYSCNAGAWLPDEETQAAYAGFDLDAHLRAAASRSVR